MTDLAAETRPIDAEAPQYNASLVRREDIETFRKYAEDYSAGRINDDQFRAQRLRRGVYGQRQLGVHMVRTKVPGKIRGREPAGGYNFEVT